jgi:dTDP-4-dehydrorhamnose reductase
MDEKRLDRFVEMPVASHDKPALWGGIECSITRVNNWYLDQLQLAGHYTRPEDIHLIAGLGISALRFPVLYEKHKPSPDTVVDWSWAAARLAALKNNNIKPIVGLVHHGSGPQYTDLSKRSFATGVASYAAELATAFPYLEFYTPVNEPLTTARFSGLYGLWYPHHNSDRSFCRMLIHELMATVLSMQAIRKINPSAKLVQTEDLGKVYCVKNLQYQAEFENERRWITFDFLCGRVDPDHYMWQYFIENGISKKELEFFLDNPCPPDIVGLNYYVTSERFLDDNLSAYPESLHGGNHIEKYVDTEAVRVDHGELSGLAPLLREVYERYSLPMAMTEVHLHCTREEQMRWFKQAWETCCHLRTEGVDIRAVTAWSLFGAFGWNKLLTSTDCDYEPGVFDLRGKQPRPTAMTKLIRSYTRNEKYEHPLLNEQGWWQRSGRFHGSHEYEWKSDNNTNQFPYVLVVGEDTITSSLPRIFSTRAIHYKVVKTCRDAIEMIGKSPKPWALITTDSDAAYEEQPLWAHDMLKLAAECQAAGCQLMMFSAAETIRSQDQEQVNTSKGLLAAISKECPSALLITHGLLFSGWDKNNFAYELMRNLRSKENMPLLTDNPRSYSFIPDLLNTALDLLIDEETGIRHLSHPERISMQDFANELYRHFGTENKPPQEFEPKNSTPFAHANASAHMMPSLHCAIENFFKSVAVHGHEIIFSFS